MRVGYIRGRWRLVQYAREHGGTLLDGRLTELGRLGLGLHLALALWIEHTGSRPLS